MKQKIFHSLQNLIIPGALLFLSSCSQNVISYSKGKPAKLPVDADVLKADSNEELFDGKQLVFDDVKTIVERTCLGCHMPGKSQPYFSDSSQPSVATLSAMIANISAVRKTLNSQDFLKVMPRGDLSFKETTPGKKLIAWAQESEELPKP